MKRMLRLPDGSWIDAKYVLMIEAADSVEYAGGGFCGPRIIVHLDGRDRRWYECANFNEACNLRDRLAEQVNADA